MPRINEMTSPACKRYLMDGGDLALVPIGAAERLGPHLPLGTRGLVSDAIAMALAAQNNGLCLPLIPYGTLYESFGQAGSLDIHPEVVHRYAMDLCDELRAGGFRRILFVGFQEELYYLAKEYFQAHHLAVAWLHPDGFYATGRAAGLDRHGRELWRLLACLEHSGQRALRDRVLKRTAQAYGQYAPVENKARAYLERMGHMAHAMAPGEWPYLPVSPGYGYEEGGAYRPPDAALLEEAQAALDDWLHSLRALPEALRAYQGFLDAHPLLRPI